MAEGRSNQGIADALVITLRAVEKYVSSIFGKLGLPVERQRLAPRAGRAAVPPLLSARAAGPPETRPPDRQVSRLPRRSHGVGALEQVSTLREEQPMKTRMIQSDPDEPNAPEDRVEPPDEPSRAAPTSPAAWAAGARSTGRPPSSAGSRFVVVAFALGIVSGTDQDRRGHLRRGRVRPRRQAPRRGLQAAGRRERARPERHAHRRRPGLRGCGRGRRSPESPPWTSS